MQQAAAVSSDDAALEHEVSEQKCISDFSAADVVQHSWPVKSSYCAVEAMHSPTGSDATRRSIQPASGDTQISDADPAKSTMEVDQDLDQLLFHYPSLMFPFLAEAFRELDEIMNRVRRTSLSAVQLLVSIFRALAGFNRGRTVLQACRLT